MVMMMIKMLIWIEKFRTLVAANAEFSVSII